VKIMHFFPWNRFPMSTR